MEAEKGTAWSLEFGAWSLEFGAWSLEHGVWSLELGAWSLDGVCHATGEGRWAGSMGAPGIRDPQRPEEVDHVRHKDVWGAIVFTTVPRDFCLSDRLVIDNRVEVLIT